MLDIHKMQNEIAHIVENNNLNNVQVEISEDKQTITMHNSIFSYKVLITPKWIGYDFSIKKSLTRDITVGDSLDTDSYPLDFDEEVTMEIYDELLLFLNNLLNDTFYYGYNDKYAIFAKPSIKKGYYDVKLFSKGLFGKGILSSIVTENWTSDRIVRTKGLHRLIADVE